MSQGTVDERVHQLVAAHREELAQLVDQALDAELDRIVQERIEARNGNGGSSFATGELIPPGGNKSPRVAPSPNATRVCVGACGRTLPVSAFEARRSKCRECRRAEHRERDRRRAEPPAAEPEPERPAIDPEIAAWAVERGFATMTPAGLAATDRGREVGGSLEL